MNKRALMLSAAAAALLSSPALAVGPTEIKTVVTTAQKTSATGDLTIDSSGGIKFVSSTVPLLTIDSSNTVNNGGVLTGAGQDAQTAVAIDANGLTGSFTTNGTIDLTGAGATKKAIDLTGASFFTGNITLDTNSSVSITGDTSSGIISETNSTLNGDWSLGGSFVMRPTTENSSTLTTIILGDFLGTTNGNILLTTGASYTAIGNGAEGIVIAAPINACSTAATPGCAEIGTFANSGLLAAAGVATRDPSKPNVEGGSALVIQNSIAGGVLNNGSASPGDGVALASITGNGIVSPTVNSPTVVFTPNFTVANGQMTIGVDTADTANPTYSFINRGSIGASPEDPNNSTEAVQIIGVQSIPIVFQGDGLLNSGTISAGATSVTPGNSVTAIAMEIGNYVTLPKIHLSAQAATSGSGGGTIAALVSGPQGGIAVAIGIDGAPVTSGNTTTPTTHVPEIDVDAGASISATAEASIPTGTTITTLSAIAIRDRSNTLTTINNSGTISARAVAADATTGQLVTLLGDVNPVATAVDASFNTTGLTFNNFGTVVGNILFGAGSDTYFVQGEQSVPATHSGDINFGFSTSGSGDFLHVGQFANVAGAITAQGALDVEVDGTGTLSIQNVGTTLATRNFAVAGGSSSNGTTNAGTVNITVSQGVTIVPVITASNSVVFGSGAELNVQYGSFITNSGQYVLIQAPTGGLHISAADVARYSAEVGGAGGTLPFLFNGASIAVVSGGGHDDLTLNVSAKSIDQLGLTGDARQMQPFANAVLARDTPLGAALIAGINSSADAQKAYDAFAPDVSGGVRAVAISLTDQATGQVAARLHDLRLFSREEGALTLWGNQFGEYMSTHGQNVAAVTSGAGQNVPTGGCTPACSTVNLNGFKDHGFGFSLGLDEGSPADGWYGAAFTFYTGDVSEQGDKQSTTQTLWYMLTGYSTWRGRGLFVDSQVNVGYGDFKGKRILSLLIPKSATVAADTTFTREADSKRAGLLASLGVTIGAQLKSGWLTSIPQLSIDGMSLREEGFTEVNGGPGFDLSVKPYYANSLRAFLGSEFRTSLNLGDFYLQPSARVGYRFDFLNDAVKLKAAFADDPSTSAIDPGTEFTIKGPDPSRGNIVAGAALNATTENWTIGLNYDFVRGSNSATEQVGSISLLGRI